MYVYTVTPSRTNNCLFFKIYIYIYIYTYTYTNTPAQQFMK